MLQIYKNLVQKLTLAIIDVFLYIYRDIILPTKIYFYLILLYQEVNRCRKGDYHIFIKKR